RRADRVCHVTVLLVGCRLVRRGSPPRRLLGRGARNRAEGFPSLRGEGNLPSGHEGNRGEPRGTASSVGLRQGLLGGCEATEEVLLLALRPFAGLQPPISKKPLACRLDGVRLTAFESRPRHP